MKSLLIGDPVSGRDLDSLLDWFDKVRIGVWLGGLMLDNPLEISPAFHIRSRMGVADRGLAVYVTDFDEPRLSIIGVNMPLFSYQPSCFGIIVNHLLFINYSSHFELCYYLGFPYPRKRIFHGTRANLIEADITYGRRKIGQPKISRYFTHSQIEYFQLRIHEDVEYSDPFVSTYTLDDNPTRSVVFESSGKVIRGLDASTMGVRLPKCPNLDCPNKTYLIEFFESQLYLYKKSMAMEFTDKKLKQEARLLCTKITKAQRSVIDSVLSSNYDD